MDTIKQQIQELDAVSFAELRRWIFDDEVKRRDSKPAVDKAQADIVTELQESGKLEKPESVTEDEAKADVDAVPEWRNPGTDHSKMYHFGDVVRYDGQLVRSTHQGLNHWEPGVLGFDGRIWEILETPTEETPEEPETTEEPETEETSESPETTEQTETPAWQPGIAVNPGQKYTHNGNTYEVIQAHTTQQGWEPPAVPALWKKI